MLMMLRPSFNIKNTSINHMMDFYVNSIKLIDEQSETT